MMQALTHEVFSNLINSIFQIRAGVDVFELELTDVCIHPSSHQFKGLRESFTLIFQAPKDLLLLGRPYRVENEAISGLDLYIIPVSPWASAKSTRLSLIDLFQCPKIFVSSLIRCHKGAWEFFACALAFIGSVKNCTHGRHYQ